MSVAEKHIVTRERMNGSYSTAAYLGSHLIVEAVMIGVMSLVCSAVVYSLVGLNPSAGRALYFALALWMALMVAESIMILISAVVPLFLVGIAAGAFLFGAFMCVQGYFTRIEFVPWPLRWLGFIGLHSYGFAAVVVNEFDGRTYAAAPAAFPPFIKAVEGAAVIDALDFHLNNKWANIGVMAAMLVAYRLLAYLWIDNFHTGKR
jgi:ABC-type multidrug transport system permease subunit